MKDTFEPGDARNPLGYAAAPHEIAEYHERMQREVRRIAAGEWKPGEKPYERAEVVQRVGGYTLQQSNTTTKN